MTFLEKKETRLIYIYTYIYIYIYILWTNIYIHIKLYGSFLWIGFNCFKVEHYS